MIRVGRVRARVRSRIHEQLIVLFNRIRVSVRGVGVGVRMSGSVHLLL